MKMLINATQRDELRSVTISARNKLLNYDVDTPQQEQKKSNIYKAVITSIEPSLGALFVNFGSERTGFLPFSNISPEYYTQDVKNNHNPDLRRLFKLGQELVVQVEKDERGNKGAALTTYISLAGAYCVLMPNNARGGGISRQIEGKERENLQEKIEQLDLPKGMGLIVRTAGVNRNADELNWDLKILLRYWDAIKQAAVAKPGPYLIHQESNVVLRSVRDNLKEDITEVIIDCKTAFEEVHDYVRLVRPDFLDRIKLHDNPTPLFSHYQIESQIEMAYQHELELPSGGSIVIDHTEALISIDVNSARATKGGNIEETALHTNLEAAEEVARQLRIRDLGGLVVIDFIDMTPPQNRREVENRLRDSLKMDRARIQTERISRFGLLEMSRQRLRRPLNKTIKENCPRCKGQGMIQSVESLASTIIHRIEQQLAKASGPLQFTIQVPTSLAAYLMNERRACLASLEADKATQITVIPNQHYETPDYSIKSSDFNPAATTQVASYEQIKKAKPSPTSRAAKPAARTFDEPIMNQYLSIPDAQSNSAGTGLFKRLITRMFGDEKVAESTATVAETPKKATNKQGDRNNRRGSSNGNRQSQGGNRRPRQRNDRQQRGNNDDRQQRGSSNSDNRRSRSNNELPIPSTTKKVEDKPRGSRPSQKADSSRTRRGNRGGSRNPAERTEKPETKAREPKPAAQPAEKPRPKPEAKPAPKATAEKVESKAVKPAEMAAAPAAEAPAKKTRRSLSSAKQSGTTGRSSRTAAKRTRPATNPAKRIKPRTDQTDS
jgi:ribonuclease E